MSANADAAGLRLDKWLWYARFFKTRALATKAISGGRFRLDGAVMSKPHRQAKPGQVLTFTLGNRIRVVRIAALGTRRGPAADAVLLYDDLAPIVPETDKPRDKPAPIFEDRGAGGGRPTKRQRRETDKLKAGFLEAED